MNLYEESLAWTIEFAKQYGLKYKAKVEDGEKYFRSKDEAQEYFTKYIPKPYTEVTLIYKSDGDFVVIEPQYK